MAAGQNPIAVIFVNRDTQSGKDLVSCFPRRRNRHRLFSNSYRQGKEAAGTTRKETLGTSDRETSAGKSVIYQRTVHLSERQITVIRGSERLGKDH